MIQNPVDAGAKRGRCPTRSNWLRRARVFLNFRHVDGPRLACIRYRPNTSGASIARRHPGYCFDLRPERLSFDQALELEFFFAFQFSGTCGASASTIRNVGASPDPVGVNRFVHAGAAYCAGPLIESPKTPAPLIVTSIIAPSHLFG